MNRNDKPTNGQVQNNARLDEDILSLSSLEEDTIYIDEIGESTTDDFDYDKQLSKLKRDSGQDSVATIDPQLPGGPAVDNLAISSSTDVTIGNQTYFQGTVIIKNLLTNSDGPFGDKKRRISVTSTINITTKDRDSPSGVLSTYVKNNKKQVYLISGVAILALIIIGLFALVISLTLGKLEYYEALRIECSGKSISSDKTMLLRKFIHN